MQPERPGQSDPRVERLHEERLDAKTLLHLGRYWAFGAGPEHQRPVGRAHQSEDFNAVGVERQRHADRQHARVLGARALHGHCPGRRLGIARVDHPGPIALEHVEERIEHITHHRLQVAGALHRAVDVIETLKKPDVILKIALGPFALGNRLTERRVADLEVGRLIGQIPIELLVQLAQ